MKEVEQKWHAVSAGQDSRPMVGKLSGNGEVFAFGGSALVGIIALRILMAKMSLAFLPAISIAALIPLGTLAFLLKFVCGFPSQHFKHTFEWNRLKRGGTALLEDGKGGDE